ncbi:RecX family transcriptional regulator [Candidatus Nomurabacteria bacterium]|uniref:Regulatory protein RecX n=1 Tax=Candidatus Dojkabacteria bacterium TaxID=2099670 RepID=A0A955I2L4_9BACT|nr:RecX family transcriptional regulator [Candidatus Dojkabacteria bacterium]MCB9790251.1 RecX family transcriptional regulator [Candidatus Nomurabacteria bacterium]MCB9803228.1 RecX family transcriptional regulator [Candidatus Nomurabacteria bacterium]
MKITRLEYQQKDQSRVNVYSENGYEFSIHAGLLVKRQLSIGVELSDDQITEIITEDLSYRLRSRAIDYLARGPKSIKQMNDHLIKIAKERISDWSGVKENSIDLEGLVDATLSKLVAEGLLDDREFTRIYLGSLLARKNYSTIELCSKLYRYGIAQSIVDEVMTEIELDEVAMARGALEKRYHKKTLERSDTKMIQFLQRKGYNWDVISELMKNDL